MKKAKESTYLIYFAVFMALFIAVLLYLTSM